MGVGVRNLVEKYPVIGKNWVGGYIFSSMQIFYHTFRGFFPDPPPWYSWKKVQRVLTNRTTGTVSKYAPREKKYDCKSTA